METFRYKSKKNQLFQTYSKVKKQFTQTQDILRQSHSNFLPSFSQNTTIRFRNRERLNNQISNPDKIRNKRKRTHNEYSRSTHSETSKYQEINNCNTKQFTQRKRSIFTQIKQNGTSNITTSKFNKIDKIMKQKRNDYQLALKQTHFQLNNSYRKTFEETVRYDLVKQNQLRLSEQQSIDIKMETKSKKSIIFKNEGKFKDHKHQNLLTEEFFIKDNNLFNIEFQSRKCFDGLFPMFRSGSSLINLGHRIFLFGGINSKLVDTCHFHQYLIHQKRWTLIKNQINSPGVVLSYHTVQNFRHSLIFIGGTIASSASLNKNFNASIHIFDTERSEWSKIKWQICIRSHASTVYGNMLVVYGGITQKGQYSNNFYFLPLNHSNLSCTNPNPYNLGTQSQGIAYHTLVNTFQVENTFKGKIRIDGIICYGGKLSNGKLNQNLKLFRFNKNKEGNQRQNRIKDWEIVQTHGVKPQHRFNHTMNILRKKCICLIIGGLNQEQIPLNDVWILDLITSTWTEAIFDYHYEIIERGIFSHTSTIVDGQIFVFGGLNADNKPINQFWSLDFTFNRAVRKQDDLKKTRHFIPSSLKLTRQFSHFRGSQNNIF